MFDYDARPATPQLILLGKRTTPAGYALRDFLSRNRVPYEWREVDDLDDTDALEHADGTDFPVCVLPDGTQFAPASVEGVANALGMVAPPRRAEYDLAILGAGPAGLAASVYAASEGLSTVAIEAVAPGGQAGTTSMIENYLGFPQGVSGSELATRATAQAERFGAEVLLARPVVDIAREGSDYTVQLHDGSLVRSRALLVATGVEWRRIEIDGLDGLLGAGVYYGAGPSEAVTCRGCRVAVVGGGNSAGQAVVRFARHASSVTLIVRGASVEASMSQYLSRRVRELSNVEVRTNAEIVEVEGDTHLRALLVASTDGSPGIRLETDALFVCIGGVPRTEGLAKVGFATDEAGYLVTGPDLDPGRAGLDGWPLLRSPLPLETNLPGLFAAGDVRSGSIKRCAAAIGEGSMAVALVHRRLAEIGADP